MKKLVLICASLGMATAATPVMAQSDDGGFRIEALAGWDRVDLSIDEANDIEGNDSGIFYGAGIGYDLPSGPVLVGIEAELSSSSNGIEEEVEDIDYSARASVEDGLNWYIGGRLGTWVSERTAFYGKVGYARTTVDVDVSETIGGVTERDSADIDFGGFRFGMGVEHKLGSKAFGKLEYRYTSYSDAEVEYDGESVDVSDLLEEVDLERHQIVAGVGLRF